jgi:class 3 adenylate cyclase
VVPLYAQTVLQHVTAILTFLAAGLMPPGSSVTTNDITYLHGAVTMLVGLGNVGFVPAVVIIFVSVTVFTPLVVALIWRIVMLTTGLTFLLITLPIVVFTLTLIDKLYRRQFLEERVSLYYRANQEKRVLEQRDLLESVVPSHVVNDLMVWLHTDLDPSQTIAKKFDSVAVGFVKFCGPISPGDEVRVEDLTDDSITKVVVVEDAWLQQSHIEADRILKRYPSLDKIKTIGDCIMIAGPFRPQFTVETAADEMLAAAWELRTISTIQVGMHLGEIVGAVLGTNRLCFDIFGDTVNVASRCATSGSSAGSISISDDFHAAIERAAEVNPASHCAGAQFSPIHTFAAKGKGDITARVVVSITTALAFSSSSDQNIPKQ